MNRLAKVLVALLPVAVIGLIVAYFAKNNIAIVDPKGEIAQKQKELIIISLALMMIVVVPVYFMLFSFAWRYRETNKKAKYSPNWEGSSKLEAIWWGVPILIIGTLSVITWQSTHALDPFKPLVSEKKPLTVQVIALDWKWLFLYPEQKLATVNALYIPTNRPINFEITSDAPMNSFWIPELGGQIYAMAGMKTKLHLNATKAGVYPGYSANLSGDGFAGMRFSTIAVSDSEFDSWTRLGKYSSESLDMKTYHQIAQPSRYEEQKTMVLIDDKILNQVLAKYTMPKSYTDTQSYQNWILPKSYNGPMGSSHHAH